jgi:hypothetical protein
MMEMETDNEDASTSLMDADKDHDKPAPIIQDNSKCQKPAWPKVNAVMEHI